MVENDNSAEHQSEPEAGPENSERPNETATAPETTESDGGTNEGDAGADSESDGGSFGAMKWAAIWNAVAAVAVAVFTGLLVLFNWGMRDAALTQATIMQDTLKQIRADSMQQAEQFASQLAAAQRGADAALKASEAAAQQANTMSETLVLLKDDSSLQADQFRQQMIVANHQLKQTDNMTIIAVRQAEAAVLQAQIALNTVLVSQRPWMTATNIVFRADEDPSKKNGGVVGLTFFVEWTNTGSSPATNGKMYDEMIVVSAADGIPKFSNERKAVSGFVAPVGRSLNGKIFTITKEIARDLSDGRIRLFVHSLLEYEDSIEPHQRYSEFTAEIHYVIESGADGSPRVRTPYSIVGDQNHTK